MYANTCIIVNRLFFIDLFEADKNFETRKVVTEMRFDGCD